MNPQFCSPERNKKGQDTCLTHIELRSVAAQYNHDNPNDKISESVFVSKSKLIKVLNSKFPKCPKNADYCWVQSSGDLYNNLKSNFRPQMPTSWKRNKREWLTNFDILYVMKQYEHSHLDFKFLGVFPVDFAEKSVCYLNNICGFNIKNLIDDKNKYFGMVLNLDKHDEPGSHWVSLYGCLDLTSKQYGICYFDSAGTEPPKLIKDFIKNIKTQIENEYPENAHKFVTKFNNTRKQFQNTECGIFSTIFLITCLLNKRLSYREIKKLIKSDPKDNAIHSFRYKLWLPPPPGHT